MTTGKAASPRCVHLPPPQSEFTHTHTYAHTLLKTLLYTQKILSLIPARFVAHILKNKHMLLFSSFVPLLNSFCGYLLFSQMSVNPCLTVPSPLLPTFLCSSFSSLTRCSKCACDSKSSPIWTAKKKQNGHMVYKHRSR